MVGWLDAMVVSQSLEMSMVRNLSGFHRRINFFKLLELKGMSENAVSDNFTCRGFSGQRPNKPQAFAILRTQNAVVYFFLVIKDFSLNWKPVWAVMSRYSFPGS